MHAAIRSPLAAGVALIGAGTIAATPIAATPPDVHISDIALSSSSQMLLSTRIMQANPIALGEELVGKTLSDATTQATRAASFPVAKALVLNLANALEGGRSVKSFTVGTESLANTGGGLLGTVQSLAVDGVQTTLALVPATVDAGLGVAASTVNAVTQTSLAGVRAVLNVGAAALTLNPLAVVNAAALGAVRIAGVAEQTTIGTAALAYTGPPPVSETTDAAFAGVRPSIVSSILNGRARIANAIFPSAVRAQSAAAAPPALTAKVTSTPVVAAKTTHKAASSGKHAKS
jgi:hypothetical protein